MSVTSVGLVDIDFSEEILLVNDLPLEHINNTVLNVTLDQRTTNVDAN